MKQKTKSIPKVSKLPNLDNLEPYKISGVHGATKRRHEMFKVVLDEWKDKKIVIISSTHDHQIWEGNLLEYCKLNDNLDPYHLIKCIRYNVLCRVEYPKYEEQTYVRNYTNYDNNGVASYLVEVLLEDHDRIIVKDPTAVNELSNPELKKFNDDKPLDYSDFSTQYASHKKGI